MITFKFELEKQEEYYKLVKDRLKTQFYQNLHFYVLPRMPEKFRSRVVYLPENCEPKEIYKKHKKEIADLETNWKQVKQKFILNISKSFPKLNSIDILISPTLYGSIGFFESDGNKLIISPRYDREIIGLQKLLINAVTKYFNPNLNWEESQKEIAITQEIYFPKTDSMLKILDSKFAGKLAEESANYLEKLKVGSKQTIIKLDNLTRSENILFNLLFRNKNKLVSFDEISNSLWQDKSEEKYSEYAITKLMERLKKKLPKNILHPQRGFGYVMYI